MNKANFILVLMFLLGSALLADEKPQLSSEQLKPGRYVKKIEEFEHHWAQPEVRLNVSEKESDLNLQSIKTPDDSTYVGILAKTQVKSKLVDLLNVLKDVSVYTSIYPGLDEIKFTNPKANEYQIHWKFSGPMGSHIVYDTIQNIVEINPRKATLTYHLQKSDDVLETDGFIFLEEVGPTVKYLSVDFFNAKWGIAGTFFKNKIWGSTYENTEKATLAIKSKAEMLTGPNAKSFEKVSVNYFGLDDREKQKTFENLESDIFDVGKENPKSSQ